MEVSVHKVRGLRPKGLDPLAHGVETTKMGFPSKKRETLPLDSENQS